MLPRGLVLTTYPEPVLLQVSTWGMFPRPRDISEAYGGGRNLKPGQVGSRGEGGRAARGAGECVGQMGAAPGVRQ